MAPSPVFVIANPASGRGRGARALPAVRRAFAAAGVAKVWTTTRLEDEALLTRRAIDEGAQTIVAVGGDGTWSNVANALLHVNPECRLAVIASGTGNDFAKSASVPARDYVATARLAVDGADARIDVGRVGDRFFLNALGVGFDVAVLERCARTPWLRGDALYLYSALRELGGYGGVDVDIEVNGARRNTTRHLLLVVANGQRFGGSFHIAPDASLHDGLLDLVAIHDASTTRRMQLFARAMRGRHVDEPDVLVERTAALTMRFGAPVSFEVDGEYQQAGASSLRIACVPNALRLVGGSRERDVGVR